MSTSNPEERASALLPLFKECWCEASGEYIVSTPKDLTAKLSEFLSEHGISKLVLGGEPLPANISKSLPDRIEILADFGKCDYDKQDAIDRCSKTDAGIGCVDALIASTGTLVVVSRNQGDRLCSSLPPIYIVISHQTPIFADLESFLKQASPDLSMTFVTGPSRTADIEKQLVLGAHGPVRVVIFGQV